MKLYAEVPRFRNRQILQDLSLVAWVLLWVRIGFHVRALVDRLAEPGRAVERAGEGFAGTLLEISAKVAEVPLVGPSLQAPFGAAGEAGAALQRAGEAQQDVVHALALWLGTLLAVIPISYVAYKYLPDRLRWVREASAADSLRIDADDLHLFALRAVSRQPLYELKRVCADPAAALQNGDYEPLARLELASLGLKIPAAPREVPR
ncbi:MAG: hypothetical protein M3N53_09555 [Actinomycetota bacterium]|nr:hypothetical protein [Actinomycetota bacterium]